MTERYQHAVVPIKCATYELWLVVPWHQKELHVLKAQDRYRILETWLREPRVVLVQLGQMLAFPDREHFIFPQPISRRLIKK